MINTSQAPSFIDQTNIANPVRFQYDYDKKRDHYQLMTVTNHAIRIVFSDLCIKVT